MYSPCRWITSKDSVAAHIRTHLSEYNFSANIKISRKCFLTVDTISCWNRAASHHSTKENESMELVRKDRHSVYDAILQNASHKWLSERLYKRSSLFALRYFCHRFVMQCHPFHIHIPAGLATMKWSNLYHATTTIYQQRTQQCILSKDAKWNWLRCTSFELYVFQLRTLFMLISFLPPCSKF